MTSYISDKGLIAMFKRLKTMPTDMTIKCKDGTVNANSSLLSAQSAQLKVMINGIGQCNTTFELISYSCDVVTLFVNYLQFGELPYSPKLCHTMLLCDMLGIDFDPIKRLLATRIEKSWRDCLAIYQACIDIECAMSNDLISALKERLFLPLHRIIRNGPNRFECGLCGGLTASKCVECAHAKLSSDDNLLCSVHEINIGDELGTFSNSDECKCASEQDFKLLSQILTQGEQDTLTHFIKTDYIARILMK